MVRTRGECVVER